MFKKIFAPPLIGAVLALTAVMGFFPPAQFAHADDARVGIYSKTIDVGNLVDAAGETETITVPGAVLGDACVASFPGGPSGFDRQLLRAGRQRGGSARAE